MQAPEAPEPPPMNVAAIDLEAFERAMYARQRTPEGYEVCAKEMWEVLCKVRRGSSFNAPDEETLLQAHTRLASAITALLSDPDFNISVEGFIFLCAEHVTLHGIFRSSSFGTMDHILGVIGKRSSNAEGMSGLTFDNQNTILLLLLCWSLESLIEVDWDILFKSAPQATQAAIVGMLAIGCTHTERGYARRLQLMGRRDIISSGPLPDTLMLAAGNLYMHSAYVDAPDKHEVKPVVNNLLRGIVERHTIIGEVSKTVQYGRTKPRIVVPVEWFGSHHAMYRCYAMSIAQLREKFEVVCVYRESEVDEAGLAAFDSAVKVDGPGVSIQLIIETIQKLEPDILFYPSVGMAGWYITISNFRLAPIQICCPGHPVSTFSRAMDYMVSDGDLFGDPGGYVEKIVPLPIGTARYIPRPKVSPRPVNWSAQRVAIPAMATKIIPPFLKTLKAIEERSTIDFEYHFFPNMAGMSHYTITRDLRRWFPNCVVHSRATYQEYIDNLTACDFAIDTYPFSGTNSAIDCLQYGVPLLCRDGREILEKSSASILRRMKMPPWMSATTEEQLIQSALRMLGGQFVGMPDQAAVEEEFFGLGPKEVHGKFLEAFWNIWEKHNGQAG